MPLWFTVVSIPFYALMGKCIALYWKTMVPMRYLVQITKSLVSGEVTDVEASPQSARAYNMQQDRQDKFAACVRKLIAANFLVTVICIRWIVNRLFLLGSGFV